MLFRQAYCISACGPHAFVGLSWLMPQSRTALKVGHAMIGWEPGPIPETIHSRLPQIRSCDPDQPIAFHKRRSRLANQTEKIRNHDHPIAFHKRWSRSANQTEKIRNQTVCCQLNHDINHSRGNLELKLRDRDWLKNVTLMISIHDITMTSQWEVWRRLLWVPIRERYGQFTACTQCCSRYNMPYLTGMCMWFTSLKIYKLLT